MSSTQKRIFIAGYYGFGNVGDEAVLDSMLSQLRSRRDDLFLTVLSERPAITAQTHAVEAVARTDWPAVIATVAQSDLVLVGGGGLINCYLEYEPEQLLRATSLFAVEIFSLPLLAWLLGRPCMIYAVGVSHINARAAREHARLAVELSNLCTVRDPTSKDLLVALGCRPEHILVTADEAFLLPPGEIAKAEELLRIVGVSPHEPYVAVGLRNWSFHGHQEHWEHALAEVLREFATTANVPLVFIPFQDSPDLPGLSQDTSLFVRLGARLGGDIRWAMLPPELEPRLMAEVLARAAMTIGMRLHACILSIRRHVPVVAIAYEPKVTNILRMAGLEDQVLSLEALAAGGGLPLLLRSWKDRAALRQRLPAVAAALADRASHNARLACELLDSPTAQPDIATPPQGLISTLRAVTARLLLDSERAIARASAAVQACRALVEAGQFAAASPVLQAMAQADPRDAETVYLAAFCAHKLGQDVAVAERLYAQALAAGKSPFWVYYNRCQLRAAAGNLESARTDYAAAARLDGSHPDLPKLKKLLQIR